MPAPMAPTSSALMPCRAGCTTTTTTAPTAPSTEGAQCSYSTTSPTRTARRPPAGSGALVTIAGRCCDDAVENRISDAVRRVVATLTGLRRRFAPLGLVWQDPAHDSPR
jgi:hypothetical protein